MRALADADVMTAAIMGELGELARDVVCSDAASFLAEATYATISDDIQVDIVAADGPTFYRWRMSREWSREQCALLSAIGRCLCKGAFTEEVALLLDHTAVGAARALAHGAGPRSWGRLYMATLLLDASDPEDAAILPDLLRAAWDAVGYPLRLQALHMVRDAAYEVSEVVRVQVAAVLEQLHTPHLLLNTALVEAQAAYGMIEPMRSLEEIRVQIEHLLASEDDSNAWGSARSVVMSRLEDEELWGPFAEAIDELSPPDRVRLLVMAARGSMPGDFGTDWILRDLVGSDALQEPRARGVLIRFASCLGPARLSVQDAVATHLEAVRGCARFCDVLPSLDVEHSECVDRQVASSPQECVQGHYQSTQCAGTVAWEAAIAREDQPTV